MLRIHVLPRFEPKPPATQSSSASRPTCARCEAKCHVSVERFWIDTYSSLAFASTKSSVTTLVYAESAGDSETSSSMNVTSLPSSATTTRRQNSAAPSTELTTRTY